jgi:hypothetical protein
MARSRLYPHLRLAHLSESPPIHSGVGLTSDRTAFVTAHPFYPFIARSPMWG